MRVAVLSALLFGLGYAGPSAILGAEPEEEAVHRFVLSNSKGYVRAETLTHRDVPEFPTGPWSVSKIALHGGKQEGVELIQIDNGAILITLCPSRGMSIMDIRSGDLRLGWSSPVHEVVHPKFIDLESRGGLGWLEGFNEWLVRCGLEYAGHPGKDEFIDNTGAKAEMNLTLHGKIGNTPASQVEVVVDDDPPHRIRVRGLVHERLFFGPKLELWAGVSTVPGSHLLRIDDEITNHGATAQEFQLIYHVNFGAPLLSKGAKVVAPVEKVAPMNAHAAKSIDQYDVYDEPKAGFIEQVYLANPIADEKGTTSVLLRNAASDRGASITWSKRELPYLTIWKNTAAEADGYVTGLEPGTGFPFNRKVERQAGRVPKLRAGESRRFSLEFGLHRTKEEVAKMAERIAGIQKGRKLQIDKNPPKSAAKE